MSKKIKVSTKTVIAYSNMRVNLRKFFDLVNTVPVCTKKIIKDYDYYTGDIICIKYATRKEKMMKGRPIKLNPKKKIGYFLNCLTITIKVPGKIANVKISSNGKFQITGCKKTENAIDCLYELKKICDVIKSTDSSIYEYIEGDHLMAVFMVVMVNLDFNLGFKIHREKLNSFFVNNYKNDKTKFFSAFQSSINTGVNIKVVCLEPIKKMLTKVDYFDKLIVLDKISFEEFKVNLDKKELKKLEKKRHHTFLVFQSGSVIQSGRGIDMKKIYHEFESIITQERDKFEEQFEFE